MSVRARQTGARVLAGAASLLLVLALVAGYAKVAAFDSEQFSNRATSALRDDSVRTLVAERITDDVVLEKQADLIAARPIIESVASDVVGSSAFSGLFRRAVRDVHRAVLDRDRDTVTLAVADVGTLLGTALRLLRPSLAAKVESTGRAEVLRRDIGAVTGDLARVAHEVRLLAVILLVLAILLAALALAVAPDRRRTVVELGVAVAAGGIVLVVAYAVVRSLALDSLEEPAGAGGSRRDLGRVPRRPEDGKPDPRRLGRGDRGGGGIGAEARRPRRRRSDGRPHGSRRTRNARRFARSGASLWWAPGCS